MPPINYKRTGNKNESHGIDEQSIFWFCYAFRSLIELNRHLLLLPSIRYTLSLSFYMALCMHMYYKMFVYAYFLPALLIKCLTSFP